MTWWLDIEMIVWYLAPDKLLRFRAVACWIFLPAVSVNETIVFAADRRLQPFSHTCSSGFAIIASGSHYKRVKISVFFLVTIWSHPAYRRSYLPGRDRYSRSYRDFSVPVDHMWLCSMLATLFLVLRPDERHGTGCIFGWTATMPGG